MIIKKYIEAGERCPRDERDALKAAIRSCGVVSLLDGARAVGVAVMDSTIMGPISKRLNEIGHAYCPLCKKGDAPAEGDIGARVYRIHRNEHGEWSCKMGTLPVVEPDEGGQVEGPVVPVEGVAGTVLRGKPGVLPLIETGDGTFLYGPVIGPGFTPPPDEPWQDDDEEEVEIGLEKPKKESPDVTAPTVDAEWLSYMSDLITEGNAQLFQNTLAKAVTTLSPRQQDLLPRLLGKQSMARASQRELCPNIVAPADHHHPAGDSQPALDEAPLLRIAIVCLDGHELLAEPSRTATAAELRRKLEIIQRGHRIPRKKGAWEQTKHLETTCPYCGSAGRPLLRLADGALVHPIHPVENEGWFCDESLLRIPKEVEDGITGGTKQDSEGDKGSAEKPLPSPVESLAMALAAHGIDPGDDPAAAALATMDAMGDEIETLSKLIQTICDIMGVKQEGLVMTMLNIRDAFSLSGAATKTINDACEILSVRSENLLMKIAKLAALEREWVPVDLTEELHEHTERGAYTATWVFEGRLQSLMAGPGLPTITVSREAYPPVMMPGPLDTRIGQKLGRLWGQPVEVRVTFTPCQHKPCTDEPEEA